MIVNNELLGYPRLQILQDTEMFHFSIDSHLLAHFVSIKRGTKKIVDFCTGNAPIPLYLTLRTDAKIVGVEIQQEAYNLALESVKLNNLDNQIEIRLEDVKEYAKDINNKGVDIITCNPPYFKFKEDSNVNKNDYLTVARHEVLLTLEDVIKSASMILKEGGYLALVYPPLRLKELFVLLDKYHFNVNRLQFVYPKRGKECNHVLVEARFGANKNENLHFLPPLYVYTKNDKWTKEVLKIYNFGITK